MPNLQSIPVQSGCEWQTIEAVCAIAAHWQQKRELGPFCP